MRQWDQYIFEELISDIQFIAWAKGEDQTRADHWNSWEKNHPLHIEEFREAVKTVRSLRFRGAEIEHSDIQYLWGKTSERILQVKPTSQFFRFIGPLTKVAAVLFFPVLLAAGWLIYSHYELTQKYSNLLENRYEQKVTVVAPIGARVVVDLPDGSKAWLNSGSEMSYPIVFNTSERRINLIGEASFKVEKSETPFFISNLGPEIKVYGTEFNVNSYKDEDIVTVALDKGKVSLDLNGKEEFLSPGQVSVFDKTRNRIAIKNSDIKQYNGWREGKYIFKDQPLSAILRILQRQQNVNIQLLNPELGNYRYKLTVDNESLDQILHLLSISAPIKYIYKRKEINADGTYAPEQVIISDDKTRIIKK